VKNVTWKKYPIYQEGSEFILADGSRAPIESHPRQSLKTDEEVVQHNLRMLCGPQFLKALAQESMGGNAGRLSQAVNTVVDRTGKIVRFTNYEGPDVTFHVQHPEIAEMRKGAPSFIKAIYARDNLNEAKMNHIVAAVALLNHKRYSKK